MQMSWESNGTNSAWLPRSSTQPLPSWPASRWRHHATDKDDDDDDDDDDAAAINGASRFRREMIGFVHRCNKRFYFFLFRSRFYVVTFLRFFQRFFYLKNADNGSDFRPTDC